MLQMQCFLDAGKDLSATEAARFKVAGISCQQKWIGKFNKNRHALIKHDDYFWVAFDRFWNECLFLTVSKVGSSLKLNQHIQVKLVQIRETLCMSVFESNFNKVFVECDRSKPNF